MVCKLLKRDPAIDILKGILIVLVVYGHTSLEKPFNYFWFRMPAFFMISGYFIKPDIEFSSQYLKKIIRRYVTPYFCWCIIMYIIFWPEHPLKNIIRIIYGGHNNITLYSYPYWFINTLFISDLLFVSILTISKKINQVCSIILVPLFVFGLYTIAHFFLPIKDFPPLPWGVDNACCAIMYLYIGHILKQFKKWNTILCIIPFIFIYICYFHHYNYQLNIADIHLEHYFLDIIIPLSFTILLLNIANYFVKVPIINQLFSKIGECTLTIFFTHAAVLNLCNGWIGIILSILIGYILHQLLKQNNITKKLFLGKYK